MSDDKRSDFDLTTPNIQLPNQGRRPPERPNTPDSSNLDRTMVNFNTPREAPRQTPPGLTPPPSRGNSFDLTAVNFQVPYDADADDDDEVAYRRAATPVAPPPPPQYQQQQYPPQQQQQYQQQQYHSGAYQPAVAPAQAAPQRRIPLWAWLTGGGLLGFMFLLVAAVGLYFFWPFNSTFTLKVLNAPNGSKVFVDDQPVGVSEESGAIIVQALRAGQMREVRVTHEGYVDWRTTVRGEGGEVKEMRVKLMPLAEPVKAADDQIAKDLDELGRARIYLNFDTDSDRIK
ncbi:MAG: PEGA domain-containing protein, partial [Pyrinomonadaceae bacterium]